MGIWNSHTSVGNIVGASISGTNILDLSWSVPKVFNIIQPYNLRHVMHFSIYILGAFVDTDWGLSFVVPGIIIIVFGIIMWLFLVPRPEGLNVI